MQCRKLKRCPIRRSVRKNYAGSIIARSSRDRFARRTFAAVATRRLAHMPAECSAESTRGSIADPFRYLANADVLLTKEILGHRHPPDQQIFHRRLAERAGEPFEECRTRERTYSCERRDGPRTCDVVVHLTNRWRES